MPPSYPFGTTALDSFNRADEGPPMTNWANLVGGLKVVSNQCAGNAAGDNWSYIGALVYGIPDIDLYITVSTKPPDTEPIAIYYFDYAVNGYAVSYTPVAGTDEWRISRLDAGVATVLGATITQELTAGDKIGIRRVHNSIGAWHHNGTSWSELGSRSDSTYEEMRANLIGLYLRGTTGRLDDLSGAMPAASAELTGTALASIDESDIVAGGKTIVITLYGDRFMPSA